jgi:siderophore ferric iron reductase
MPQNCHDLIELLHVAARALPGLTGEIGPAGNDQLQCGSTGNQARVAALHAHWQHAYPEAGAHYWSARSWSLLVWQPVYLSLLAVHLCARAPSLAQMGQSMRDGFICGFRLPEHRPCRGTQSDLIACASSHLRRFVDDQLTEFNGVASIHPKMARLLVADCLRAALLLVQPRASVTNAALHEIEARWLEAMALPGGGSLVEIGLSDSRQCLALGRKVCCQHFRRADGEPCSSCPKLKPEERTRRLRDELIAGC